MLDSFFVIFAARSRSIALLLRTLRQCSRGKAIYSSVSSTETSTFLATAGNFISRSLATTSRAFALAASRSSCQVHLDQGFLDAYLSLLVALDDGCFKCQVPKLGHLQFNIACSRQELAPVMARTCIFSCSRAFVTTSICEAISFLIQKSVRRVFHALTDKLIRLIIDYALIQL